MQNKFVVVTQSVLICATNGSIIKLASNFYGVEMDEETGIYGTQKVNELHA